MMYHVTAEDGARIAVYDLKPKRYSKTVVLIHGWPLSHEMFEYQLPALQNDGCRVVSLDLRGFGNSEETADGYTYTQFASDLYYVIRALRLNEFILVGFSMGGAVAARYMALFNGFGVAKLCFWDAAIPSYCKTPRNPYGASQESANKLINLGYRDRPALNKYFGGIFFARQHSVSFMDWLQNVSNKTSGIGEMKSLQLLRDADLFDDLKSILVPTGIFHGRQDQVCPFGMAEIVHRTIPHSTLFPFEHAGHGAFYDDMDTFNNTLIRFINQ